MSRSASLTQLTIFASLAGLAYCSWPLGNILNPIANQGLASNLEATGQPYNWLFVGLDIVCGVLIGYVTWRLYRQLTGRKQARWLRAALIGFGLFGLLTAVDAVLPLDCVASATVTCRPILQDPYFIVHGIASVGSTNGLTVSIVALWWLLARKARTGGELRWTLHGTMLVWFGFGTLTAVLISLNKSSTLAQHIFIIICSLWTAAMPYLTQQAAKRMVTA